MDCESDKFCLRWNDFETNISSAFRELRDQKDFFDLTLACEDEEIQVHKVILAACSPFFRNILRRHPHQHPLLYLKGVKYSDLQSVLNFMYHGEVNVAQEDLNSFLALAADLKIKGLTENHTLTSAASKHSTAPTSYPPLLKAAPRTFKTDSVPPLHHSRPVASSAYTTTTEDSEVVPVKSEPRDPLPIPSPQAAYEQSNLLTTEDDLSTSYRREDYPYEDERPLEDQLSAEGNKVEVLIKEESVNSIIPDDELEVCGGLHKCKLCYKSLDCLDTAKNHILAHFALPGGLTCLQCGLSFDSKVLFGIHMASEHKNIKKW